MFSISLEKRMEIVKKVSFDARYFNYSYTIKNFQKSPKHKNAMILDQLTPAQVLSLVLRNKIEHVVQNSFQPIEDKCEIMQVLEKKYSAYYEHSFNFLKNIKKRFMVNFKVDDSRQELLNLIFKQLGLDIASSRSIPLFQVVEELIMNVQMNEIHQKMAKPTTISTIVVEMNEDMVSVAVTDPFGDLKLEKLLIKIESALNIGIDNSINYGRGGAGLGSTIIYNNADSLYIGCIPNNTTKVAVTMPYSLSEKKLLSIQKSLHIIKTDSDF